MDGKCEVVRAPVKQFYSIQGLLREAMVSCFILCHNMGRKYMPLKRDIGSGNGLSPVLALSHCLKGKGIFTNNDVN